MKKYIIDRERKGRVSPTEAMTIPELVEYHAYTLECGASEKGNKKINVNPKTINSLVTNLNNAVNNNGYSDVTFSRGDI